MTLDEFIKTYEGAKVDYDGRYGAQCVDLFRQYCKDVLQIPHTGGVTGAAELYTKYDKLPLEQKYFDKIVYAGGTPEPGDVVVFRATRQNEFGHVAIVLSADNNGLLVFEQDGFKQDGAKITRSSYKTVLGFLRVKRRG